MKFYEFKNVNEETAEMYVYGEIIWDKLVGWGWESDVSPMDFKKELDSLGDSVKTINIFINSPGGDVFAASAIISMLERVKANGVTIVAYVDGISASAASFLMMAADEICLYKNSIVMIHKPMTWSFGNTNDLQKAIDTLGTIEENVMMPMYMSKAKIPQEKIAEMINAETWLNATEMGDHFEVTLLDDEKTAVASMDSQIFKTYKNTPESIKTMLQAETISATVFPVAEIRPDEKESEVKNRLGSIRESIISRKLDRK